MTSGRIFRRIIGLTLLLGLGACAPLARRGSAPAPAPAPSQTTTAPTQSTPRQSAPPVPAPTPPSSPAVVALLAQAKHERRAGHLERSDAALERALHIEPRNPRTWYRMAQVRLEEGNSAQAEAFALKCIRLSRADRRLQARAWALIASARRAQGDAQGAAAARARATALQRQS